MKFAKSVAAAIVALGIGAWAYFALGTPTPNAPAPDVGYTLLDGSRSNLAALRGKVVLVNFWATTCTTCVREMPQLAATHERFKARGLETLAVALRTDPPAAVIRFAETRRLPFGVVIDNTGAIAKGFGDVQLTPTSFVVDKRGVIVERYVGAPDFAVLQRLIDRLLRES